MPTSTREERIRDKAKALDEKEGRDPAHWQDAEKLVTEADSIAAGQPSKDPCYQPRNR